jgi:ribonuclease Z
MVTAPMRTLFHPFLPNGLTGDPVAWVDLPGEGRSVLLDLGDLRCLPNRKLIRVDRVVVTHTHIDHFIGFDRLLRLALRRPDKLVITGPRGFIECVRGKIAGYTWNVIESYPVHLVAEELDGDTVRSVAFTGRGGMQPEPLADRPHDGTLHAESAFNIKTEILDHGIPVLAVCLQETERLSVNKDALTRSGLVAGSWLRDLKQMIRDCRPPQEPIDVETAGGGTRRFESGELAGQILWRSRGQRIAYCTDFSYTPRNRDRVVALADGADLLICEAAFLHEDDALAHERHHLTARQAGELAREAGVTTLAPFHLSTRYPGREDELLQEAAASFGGPVVQLPRGGEPSRRDSCYRD